jgi:hypothetical protein
MEPYINGGTPVNRIRTMRGNDRFERSVLMRARRNTPALENNVLTCARRDAAAATPENSIAVDASDN